MDLEVCEDHRMLRGALGELLASLSADEPLHGVAKGPDFAADTWQAIAAGGWLEIAAAESPLEDEGSTAFLLAYLTEETGARLISGPFASTAAFVVPYLSRASELPPDFDLDAVTTGAELVATALPVGGTPAFPDWACGTAAEQNGGDVRVRATTRHVAFGHLARWLLVPVAREDGTIATALVNLRDEGTAVVDAPLDLVKPTATVAVDARLEKSSFVNGYDRDQRESLTRWLAHYLLCISAESVGGADEVKRRTIEHVSTRHQFGVPVGSFQAVKHRLAEAHRFVELARGYAYYVAWLLDNEAWSAAVDLAVLRVHAADGYVALMEHCIQCHGGAGFTWEQALHYWYRQATYYRHHVFAPNALRRYIAAAAAAAAAAGADVSAPAAPATL